MPGIVAGKLNRRLEFYRQVVTQNDTGQEVKSYTFDFYAMAYFIPVRGMERTKHEREEMLTSQARFRVRYKGSISATHIIKINGQFWNIQNLAPLGRLNRDIVEIMAEQLDVSKVVIT